MSALDFIVLIGSMLGIAAYGIWRTRGRRDLNAYLRGDGQTAWFAIGLSVMATQASAITFLSTPGQGYLGGTFLMLSYFGADQSQVQRYISGSSLRESRLGLMFNAVCKIPMQFCILLLGVLMFVFYQFERPPLFFNPTSSRFVAEQSVGQKLSAYETEFNSAHAQTRRQLGAWLKARHEGNPSAAAVAFTAASASHQHSEQVRADAAAALRTSRSGVTANDADYVFITFILHHLPHGVIGLLVAAFFAAALSSKAAELNALGSSTTIDFYRHVIKPEATDADCLAASKCFTALWGLMAIGFALYAHLVDNLVQAVNILGSIFYGVMLGLFVVAFFVRWVGGGAVFWAALAAQALVFVLYFRLSISYLWYPLIGCAACVLFSLVLQASLGGDEKTNPALTP
jgi:solute:Na+ symporter, SSS family